MAKENQEVKVEETTTGVQEAVQQPAQTNVDELLADYNKLVVEYNKLWTRFNRLLELYNVTLDKYLSVDSK